MGRTLSRTFAAALGLIAGTLALGHKEAQAGFTVTLSSSGPNGGGATLFNYTATTASGDSIIAGNYFRIYDFGGYVPGSALAPANWTITESKYDGGLPPSFVLVHGDDAAIFNLTFTYTGSSPLTGPSVLTGFSALSAFNGELTIANFVGTNANSATPGGVVDAMGDVNVPKNNNIYAAPAPEPASVISTTIGAVVLGLGFARRRWTRREG
ncbi:MAG: hypothetical protein U0794_06245 [Isosphaeraceae bacterium]